VDTILQYGKGCSIYSQRPLFSWKYVRVLEKILLIWSHQIPTGHKETILYGRGSPETNYKPQTANMDELSETFSGALPTTIRRDFSEIYGLNPDIDSTALMVSSTFGFFLNY
jgi:hypothetical protein